jgi:BolA protein
MQNFITWIESLLRESLNVQKLEIIDESAQHAGHLPMRDYNHDITHVCIRISSTNLEGLNRVNQHRMLYEILQPVIDAGLHAVRFYII